MCFVTTTPGLAYNEFGYLERYSLKRILLTDISVKKVTLSFFFFYKLNYLLQAVPTVMRSVTMSRFLSTKIIDSNGKKFSYNDIDLLIYNEEFSLHYFTDIIISTTPL